MVTVMGMEFGNDDRLLRGDGERVRLAGHVGKLIIDSINVLDRPVIVAYLMIIVLLFVAINLTVDLLYTVLDPRVRL